MRSVRFCNGVECPQIGLGTYNSEKEDCYRAVKHALSIGYRHIDTALYYQNEVEIGRAVNEKIADGTLKREDVFITSKLWNTFHQPDLVELALKSTLKDLNLDYLDLYLIHWPTGFQDGWNLSPKDHNDKMLFSDVDFVDTWKAMEALVEKGLVKSIGLSNFNENQILRILACAKIWPVNNQIEIHPYLVQEDLVNFCRANNITITAYRPLGGPPKVPGNPIHDEAVQKVAKKYARTGSQIMLKFLLQRNIIVIPKSSNKDRIEENLNVFDFILCDDDMVSLMSLDRGEKGRGIKYEVAKNHKYYPFDVKC